MTLQGRKVWLVKLEGTDSPEAADALRGCKLLIRPMDRPPLDDEDEFYAQVLLAKCRQERKEGKNKFRWVACSLCMTLKH